MRSIRFSLQHREVFEQQVRAILRAGVDADLRIMFPMISSLDEFVEARQVVYHCAAALKKEGLRGIEGDFEMPSRTCPA